LFNASENGSPRDHVGRGGQAFVPESYPDIIAEFPINLSKASSTPFRLVVSLMSGLNPKVFHPRLFLDVVFNFS